MTKIKNWDKFQHFRDRKPPWIKLYRDLLDDREWFDLSGDTAKVLVMLWLIASEDGGVIPQLKDAAFRLRMTEPSVQQHINKLSHWLEQVDINTISTRYQNDAPETEIETEKRQSDTPDHSDIIREIWRTYPTNKHRADQLQIPRPDADAIIDAVAQDRDRVLIGVKAYKSATDTWPASERKFIHKLVNFMREREYLKDPAEWQRSGKPTEPQESRMVNPADIVRKQREEMGFLSDEEARRQARERGRLAAEKAAQVQ